MRSTTGGAAGWCMSEPPKLYVNSCHHDCNSKSKLLTQAPHRRLRTRGRRLGGGPATASPKSQATARPGLPFCLDMLGIVPAAGAGSRLQPLAFSKELLPVASGGIGRAKAVAEFVVDRMLAAGADRVGIVIGPEKADLLRHFGRLPGYERLFYTLQPRPLGLCDAIFRVARHVRPYELVLIGLPDTIWHPADAFTRVPTGQIHLITFPVTEPEFFDAVRMDSAGRVERIEVKTPARATAACGARFRLPESSSWRWETCTAGAARATSSWATC